jgi:MYXO-CTERM domain-containing protein
MTGAGGNTGSAGTAPDGGVGGNTGAGGDTGSAGTKGGAGNDGLNPGGYVAGGGCQCNATGSAASPFAYLLLGLLLLVRRRR